MSEQAAASRSREWSVGVDIGGTFTDVILSHPSGAVVTVKVLSTPPSFEQGVMTAVERVVTAAGVSPEELARVVHGTTVATNAILESEGALTGVLTTRGFRDVLEIGRLRRPSLYDLQWTKPEPLAPRHLRLELSQRIAADGSVLKEIDEHEVRRKVDELVAEGVRAVSICLINSYANPAEERRVAQIVRAHDPSLFVTASVDVSPEPYEFERLSTATVNSYVGPVVEEYVSKLTKRLRERSISAPITIMQSTGGLLEADVVMKQPVQIIESGPAAGVIAVLNLAQELGLGNVVAFDMGGTTAKASLIEHGMPVIAADYEVGGGMNVARGLGKGAGYAIRFPSIDIAEVGAGGGSIVHADEAGALHVGPRSAQAFPGPACYGRGGTQPTLTDANVVLGYLSPSGLAGGTVDIDVDAATSALRSITGAIGLDPQAAARGAYEVAVSNMTQAVKAVTSERGRDPRDSVLVAFGGAGPLYGAYLAKALGIARVIVPRHPGLFSAVGLLTADIERQIARPVEPGLADGAQLGEVLEQLETQLRDELFAQQHDGAAASITRIFDMRYRGQRFELRIPVPAGAFDDEVLQRCRDAFHEEHHRTYGRSGPDELVQITNVRVIARLDTKASIDSILTSGSLLEREQQDRLCRFDRELLTRVTLRQHVSMEPEEGPCVIEDMDSTILVPPGARYHRDHLHNIVIEWPKAAEGGAE